MNHIWHRLKDLRQRILPIFVMFSMAMSLLPPLMPVHATVIDGSGNTLSWANNAFVNLSNSGSYAVGFSLSGTLDPGNTLLVTATDNSLHGATGSYVSSSGGESTGSVPINFSGSGWHQGTITFEWTIYSGSTATAVVASGMLLVGTLDTIRPSMTLTSTAPSTISWAISVTATATEPTSDFVSGDISLTNATISGFNAQSSTGYTFTVTPTVATGAMTVGVWTGVFSDAALNTNTSSNTLSYNINMNTFDTISPVVTIASYASGATVTGAPTLSGTVSDAGWVTSVTVNGSSATLWSGTWSKTALSLTGWANTVTVIATDTAGNTGSTSIVLNRIPLTSDTNVSLSGTTSAIVTFSTDLSATGVVRYGTSSGALNLTATGTSPGTTHSFTLTGLTVGTTYYFRTEWLGGVQSTLGQFRTPTSIDVANASGSISAIGSVYLSGSTATGATFLGSGSLAILSLTSSGSSLTLPLHGLTIIASGSAWDGVIQAPEITSHAANIPLTSYAFTGMSYEIGNPNTELIFSGQLATVSMRLSATLSGQTARVFRSVDHGVTYTEFASAVINSSGDCIFTTDRLSIFAFAVPADTTPDAFDLSDIANADLSTRYTSNAITVSGTTGPSAISVTGGEYSIDSAAFTSLFGSVNPLSMVILRATSSSSYATSQDTVLSIGGVSSTFVITTKSAPNNTGGGGWGGGWGGGLSLDNCPDGDNSWGYYDGICDTILSGSNIAVWGNILGGVVVGSFDTPGVMIDNFGDIRARDIAGNWAEPYILRLIVRGIVDNVEFYRPNAYLTRAEFLKIVINTTGWNLSSNVANVAFADVTDSSWYAPYVSLALTKGMIAGTNASFRPNDTITRAEATKILVIALGVTVQIPQQTTFVDLDLTTDLMNYIEAARALDILSGQMSYGRSIFRPNDSMTRSEIAKIVVNAFDF